MPSPPAAPDFGLPGNPAFPSTHWSVVWAAFDSGSPSSTAALEHLCAAYWYPLYVFARRKGEQVEDAQDLVQGFFREFLEKKWLRQVDPGRGRLRTFLLACFGNFQSNEWRKGNAAKRGQGRIESLEALLMNAEERYRIEPRDEVDPATLYDRLWILGIVERAMERLAAEFNNLESAKPAALGESDLVMAFETSRAGDSVLTALQNGSARLWATHTGRALGPELRSAGPIVSVALSPDGIPSARSPSANRSRSTGRRCDSPSAPTAV